MTDSNGFFVWLMLVVWVWFSGQRATDSRQQTADSQQTANSRQQTADFGSADNRPQQQFFVLFGWF
jgi:hypothetical protein